MAQLETAAPLQGLEQFRKARRQETEGNGLDKDIVVYFGDLRQLTREPEEVMEGQKISPEALYGVKLPAKEVNVEISKILKVRAIIQDSIDCLSKALDVEDEIERESVMNIFNESVFKLTAFLKINKNFKDAICLIQTAVEGQIKSVYDRDKILALEKVLALMKGNILMDEEILNECFDIFESASFDINAPLAGTELAL